MWLPTQDQVNAATRNIAAAVSGAILLLGISTKFDPSTVTIIINAAGHLAGNVVTFLGVVGPIIASYYAAKAASAKAQAASITRTEPGTVVVTTKAIADATPDSPNVVSADTHAVVVK